MKTKIPYLLLEIYIILNALISNAIRTHTLKLFKGVEYTGFWFVVNIFTTLIISIIVVFIVQDRGESKKEIWFYIGLAITNLLILFISLKTNLVFVLKLDSFLFLIGISIAKTIQILRFNSKSALSNANTN